jgi:hydrogenase/urease accessory protein HupE
LALATTVIALGAQAHEVRPAYLELTETRAGVFSGTWKQPVLDNRRLRIRPDFPADCQRSDESAGVVSSSLVERFTLTCPLNSGVITIDGLDLTLTDVFVRVTRLGEPPAGTVLRPSAPFLDLSAPVPAALPAYLRVGVEHILFGWDHLLFVAGMVLLVARRQLLATITAFTLAHSITLGLAMLGGVTLPGPPVEITIALSIALLGVEAANRLRGRPGLGARIPWAIAFGFGLIHGFGFAGALAQIGLPAGSEALALLLFNAGVELGQIVIIAGLLGLAWCIRRAAPEALARSQMAGAYVVGTAGMFWAVERVTAFI